MLSVTRTSRFHRCIKCPFIFIHMNRSCSLVSLLMLNANKALSHIHILNAQYPYMNTWSFVYIIITITMGYIAIITTMIMVVNVYYNRYLSNAQTKWIRQIWSSFSFLFFIVIKMWLYSALVQFRCPTNPNGSIRFKYSLTIDREVQRQWNKCKIHWFATTHIDISIQW